MNLFGGNPDDDVAFRGVGVGCDRLGNMPLGGGWLAAAGASTGFNAENTSFFGAD